MSRARALWLGTAGAAVAVVTVLLLLAWSRLPSQQEAAQRVAAVFAERTGVEVDIAHVRWSLWPAPTLVIENAVTQQPSPIVARHIRLQATWRALLKQEMRVERVDLDGALVPHASLRELDAVTRGAPAGAGALAIAGIPGARLRFRGLSWVDRRDVELEYEGDIDIDADGFPRRARVARAGAPTQTQLRLERQGGERRWRVLIDAAGGTWNGQAELADTAAGRLRLQARLEPRNLDVQALAAAFKRHSVVAGRANGNTTIDAEGETPWALVRSLRTHTRFAIRPARLPEFDMVKAVRSAGNDTRGQTVLDELGGQLETQNTGNGMLFRYTDLKMHSGLLSASGSVRLLRSRIEGEGAIDIVDGVVGIPLKISGTVEEPEFSLSGGALTGAAVGTAVLPGVGTALGARIGQEVERLLGEPSSTGQSRSPARNPPR